MPYEKPVREMLKEFARAQRPGQVFSRRDIRNWFRSAYPEVRITTVDRQTTALTTNIPSRVYWSPPPSDDIFFRLRPDAGDLRLYDPATDPTPIHSSEIEPTDGDIYEADNEPSSSTPLATAEFAVEAHLRDFLAKDITRIEPGLRLFELDDVIGVEVPMGGNRSADLVAIDRDGSLLVIELKVSRGPYVAVGQLLRYMGFAKRHYATGRKVRGMILAATITDDLRIATEPLRDAGMDIALRQYTLNFTISAAETQ